MRVLSGSRRAVSLVAVGATLVLTGTGLAAASTPRHEGQDGRAAFAASAREVRAAGQFRTGHYIVLLKQAPAATYQGGIPGVPATARNGSFNADAPAVKLLPGFPGPAAEHRGQAARGLGR